MALPGSVGTGSMEDFLRKGLSTRAVDSPAAASGGGARPHPIRQTTTPAPASGGGSPSCCSPALATAKDRGRSCCSRWSRSSRALDVRDAERVDVAVEGIGDGGYVPCITLTGSGVRRAQARLADRRGEHRPEPVLRNRIVSGQLPIRHQNSRPRSDAVRIAAYIITVRRIASGELLKQRNGFRSAGGDETPPSGLKPICSDAARPPYAQ